MSKRRVKHVSESSRFLIGGYFLKGQLVCEKGCRQGLYLPGCLCESGVQWTAKPQVRGALLRMCLGPPSGRGQSAPTAAASVPAASKQVSSSDPPVARRDSKSPPGGSLRGSVAAPCVLAPDPHPPRPGLYALSEGLATHSGTCHRGQRNSN